jgi:hypothetical protein
MGERGKGRVYTTVVLDESGGRREWIGGKKSVLRGG